MAISPKTREMLALLLSGLGPCLSPHRRSRACKLLSADKAATGCAVARDRAARDGIEHPDRDLLQARDGRVHKRAARRRAGRALDHLVEGEPDAQPRDAKRRATRDLVARAGTMGLVVRGCTTPADRIRALTGRRRIKPTSLGCRNRGGLNPAGLHLPQRKLLFRQTEPPLGMSRKHARWSDPRP